MKIKFLLIAVIILVSACDQNEKKAYNKKITLEKKSQGTRYFPLDSMSKVDYSVFYEGKEEEWIYMLNRYTNSIYKYNFKNRSIDTIMNFPVEGANNVGKITGFTIASEDSIFLYSYHRAKLYLVNTEGDILKDYSFYERDEDKLLPYVDGQNRAIINDNKIFFTSKGLRKAYSKNSNYPSTSAISLDIESGNFDFLLPFSDAYKDEVWGIQYYNLTAAINKKDKIKAFSFMIDENISVLNADGITEEFYAGSDFIDEIPPLADEEIEPMNLRQELNNYYSKPFYYSIYYDRFSDLYYRFVYLPAFSESEIKKTVINDIMSKREFAVVILDNTFQKIGEVKLDSESYDASNVFFTREGMYILNKNVDENQMRYDLFKPKNI